MNESNSMVTDGTCGNDSELMKKAFSVAEDCIKDSY